MADEKIDILIHFEILDCHVSGLHECLVPSDHLLVDIDELEGILPILWLYVPVVLID